MLSQVDEGQAGTDERERLRRMTLAYLADQGFVIEGDRIAELPPKNKDAIRNLHSAAVKANRKKAAARLAVREEAFVSRLAAGDEIAVERIVPRLVQVHRKTSDADLWRWCALHWTVPVSNGYGRRLRFLVLDEAHDNKVMGVIGLADPVFAMRARDEWVGWTADERKARLTNVMDAFVLGAVPPYSNLIGGKLVALLAACDEVRSIFHSRYGHRKTIIAERDPDARLLMVTTTSAFGRSSVYNRLTGPDRRLAWIPLGYTSGSGDFHFPVELYDELAQFAERHCTPKMRNRRWGGSGFRNRREILQEALTELGLPSRSLLMHGVRRQVFAAPLAHNTLEILRGEQERPTWRHRDVAKIGQYWVRRWATKRADSDPSYKDFDPSSWMIWP